MMTSCREDETAPILSSSVVMTKATTDIQPLHSHVPPTKRKTVISLITCFSWVSMGGLQGLLGAAIPVLAKHLSLRGTTLGWVFTVRAGGYIAGSFRISRLHKDNEKLSEIMSIGCAGLIASLMNFAIPRSNSLLMLLALCFIQGFGLSTMSTLGNIVLIELWGYNAGPWLQALHFSFGIGAILSSLLLGVSSGLLTAFDAFACLGTLPFLAVIIVEGFLSCERGMDNCKGNKEMDEEGFMTRQYPSNSAKDIGYEEGIEDWGPTGAGETLHDILAKEGEGESKCDHLVSYDRWEESNLPVFDQHSTTQGILAPSSMYCQGPVLQLDSSVFSNEKHCCKRSRQGHHGRCLSLTFMPFQETLLALPLDSPHSHHQQSSSGWGRNYDLHRSEKMGRSLSVNEAHIDSYPGSTSSARSSSSQMRCSDREGRQRVAIATDLNLGNTRDAVINTSTYRGYDEGLRKQEKRCREKDMKRSESRPESLDPRNKLPTSIKASFPASKTPLPDSIKWLLTIFLGLYVGGESGFGGWISTFVVMEGATASASQAALLVSIFWAAVTVGRAVAVGQALLVGPSWSLRFQLLISLCGALVFWVAGAASFIGAAVAAGKCTARRGQKDVWKKSFGNIDGVNQVDSKKSMHS